MTLKLFIIDLSKFKNILILKNFLKKHLKSLILHPWFRSIKMNNKIPIVGSKVPEWPTTRTDLTSN